ncbi:MAG: DUF1385 domain-containing protein [Oscillospiraceae bacterium]|nr:DUF1385 domain-containing protein [Oscillospiraceae bacterium]MCL2278570.1 DUF1385 domain-containing protein [Oscillospiraceae bacterium]
MNNNEKSSKDFRTSIGGQALIEGIMMRGPKAMAIVVRGKDGLVEKVDEFNPIRNRIKFFGLPFIRGIVNFGSSMSIGMRSLMFSADHMPEEDQEEPTKFDIWVEEKFGSEKSEKILLTFAVVLGIAFSVGLFMLLPTFLAGFATEFVENPILRNLIEGALRITIFLTYLALTSKMKQIRRVWAYHGAEHKAIYCYEKRLPLTVENVRAQSPLHPRCGTSFLFIVMIVSILVFSFTTWDSLLLRFALRIALLPIVVAISYEIIRLAGRYDNFLTRIISAPGKALQNFTTREPDDDMIEVAIKALEHVIPENETEAKW